MTVALSSPEAKKESPVKTEPAVVKKNLVSGKSGNMLTAEHGTVKICTNPDDYFGFLADFWNSPEEVKDFLERRKKEIWIM